MTLGSYLAKSLSQLQHKTVPVGAGSQCAATLLGLGFFLLVVAPSLAATDTVRTLVVTNNLTLERDAVMSARLVIRANYLVLDGNGATLAGPGKPGDLSSLETAGPGILAEGCVGVTIRNVKVRGFATGLVIADAQALVVAQCDFSDNYHHPDQGWGELPARGGIQLLRVHHSVFDHNQAHRVWNGVHLLESDDNLFTDNDFSHCSNTCASLWKSSRNRFLRNQLSHGLRINRAAGEVHARDSTGVLLETGSDDNYWYRNNLTYGGDGLFIRVLNGWVSRGNVFEENDCSYANNNCIESWSPGNTYIRNLANHGSYGFWLGGSDQTVLIGNEAAYNGQPDGFHNAPQPVFAHGGIVIVAGPSSHTLITGNYIHDNHGAGLAFRGDDATQGQRWRTHHWIVQQNRIENNRWGIWGRWGDGIYLANNHFTNNLEGNWLAEVSHLQQPADQWEVQLAPIVRWLAPDRVQVGQKVRFDAGDSRDPQGRLLRYRWSIGETSIERAGFDHVFIQPGFYRVGLTVDNGILADLAYRDLLVVEPVEKEFGTEGQAASWGFELEGNTDNRGAIRFADDSEALIGRQSLRFTPDPYPGAYATAVFPGARNAGWDFSKRQQIRFWLKTRNPNLPGFQNAGPVVRLLGADGIIEYTPRGGRNLLVDLPFSEARWTWMPVVIPLAGNETWERKTIGLPQDQHVDALSLSLDSWGGAPFTVWLDGLTIE